MPRFAEDLLVLVRVQVGLATGTVLRELVLEPLAPDHALRVRSFPNMQPVGFRVTN